MHQRKNRSKKNSSLSRLGGVVKSVMGDVPGIGAFTKRMERKIQRVILKTRITYRSKRSGILVDEIYMVEPNRIVFCTPLEFDPFKDIGKVIGGNWDKTDINFEDLDIFEAIKARYVKNVPWKSTEYYKNMLQRIHRGELLWRYRSEKDLIVKCQNTDQLLRDIKENGYKAQLELNGGNRTYSFKYLDEISVNIDRNGRMLFNNSVHRLAISKLLNVKKVPVVITVRHSDMVLPIVKTNIREL